MNRPQEIESIYQREALAISILNAMQNPEDWKLATAAFVTTNLELARDVVSVLDLILGGHEIVMNFEGEIEVTSKGYYHYVGT